MAKRRIRRRQRASILRVAGLTRERKALRQTFGTAVGTDSDVGHFCCVVWCTPAHSNRRIPFRDGGNDPARLNVLFCAWRSDRSSRVHPWAGMSVGGQRREWDLIFDLRHPNEFIRDAGINRYRILWKAICCTSGEEFAGGAGLDEAVWGVWTRHAERMRHMQRRADRPAAKAFCGPALSGGTSWPPDYSR